MNTERLVTDREIRLGKTENSFFVGISSPLGGNESTDSPEQGVVHFESAIRPDGSQVFIYPRALFGMAAEEREAKFVEYAESVARRLGAEALNTEIIEIERGVTSLFEAAGTAAA